MNDTDKDYARNALPPWIQRLALSGIQLLRPPQEGADMLYVRRANSPPMAPEDVSGIALHARQNMRAMIDFLLSEGKVILMGGDGAPQLVGVPGPAPT
jgi:hypothetical protein